MRAKPDSLKGWISQALWYAGSPRRPPVVSLIPRGVLDTRVISSEIFSEGSILLQPESFFGRESRICEGDLLAFKLSEVELSSPSGYNFIDGKVVLESNFRSGDVQDGAALHKAMPLSGVRPRRKSHQTLRTLLATSNPKYFAKPVFGNYYHWLIEELPRVIYATKSHADMVILHAPELPDFALRTLSCFDHEKIPVPRGSWRVKNQIVISGSPSHIAREESIRLLRSFFKVEAAKSRAKTAKLYVSRVGASRSPFFEAELEEILAARGFTILRSRDLVNPILNSRLFQDASLVVGFHGAGLANIAFCQPGTRVIELFEPDFWNGLYFHLANRAGLDYSQFETPPGSKEIPPGLLSRLSNSS